VTCDHVVFSTASPASLSALSFPGVSTCAFVQKISADRFSKAMSSLMIAWIFFVLGSGLVWLCCGLLAQLHWWSRSG